MTEENKLPEFVLDLLLETSDGTNTAEVIAIKLGQKGYTKTTWGRQTNKWVNDQNQLLGIDFATKMAYSLHSHIGEWDKIEQTINRLRKRLATISQRGHHAQ